MHDQGPNPNPCHKGEEVGSAGCDDVVDGVGKDGDGASYADDDQWLGCETCKDDTAED